MILARSIVPVECKGSAHAAEYRWIVASPLPRSRRRTQPVAALQPVVEAADSLRVEHGVVGSVASSVHGVARPTVAADLVADLARIHVDALVAWQAPCVGRGHVASSRPAW